jgi:hypothetical protein
MVQRTREKRRAAETGKIVSFISKRAKEQREAESRKPLSSTSKPTLVRPERM